MVAPGSLEPEVKPSSLSPLSRAARTASPPVLALSPNMSSLCSRPRPSCLPFSSVLPSSRHPFPRAKGGQLCFLSSVCRLHVVRAVRNCFPFPLCAPVSACL